MQLLLNLADVLNSPVLQCQLWFKKKITGFCVWGVWRVWDKVMLSLLRNIGTAKQIRQEH